MFIATPIFTILNSNIAMLWIHLFLFSERHVHTTGGSIPFKALKVLWIDLWPIPCTATFKSQLYACPCRPCHPGTQSRLVTIGASKTCSSLLWWQFRMPTDEGAQVTNEANFALTSGNPNCPPDVCCRGIRACSFLTNISGVSSAACSSSNACEQVTMFLSRDLFCSRRDACKRGIFRSQRPAPDLQSTASSASAQLQGSQMFFTAGNVELQCPGRNTCITPNISLSRSSCIHIKCDVLSCFDMSVVDDDSSGSRCFCSGAGCTNLVGPLTCETPLTVSPCCLAQSAPRSFV